jgi:hypothetical protein
MAQSWAEKLLARQLQAVLQQQLSKNRGFGFLRAIDTDELRRSSDGLRPAIDTKTNLQDPR